MNAATARTIREALGLTTARLAELMGLAGLRDVQRAEAGSRLVTRRHAELLLYLEQVARIMIGEMLADLAEMKADDVAVIVRYRVEADMPVAQCGPFELHAAAVAALRLRLGEQLMIVDFDRVAYAAWLDGRQDTQALRAAWAASARQS
jgi:transcriptional regulator with XRE-family HTH domain